MSTQSSWPERLAAAVGTEVQRLRTLRSPKMSAQQLADRTAELGHPLTRSTIASLESGRRGTVTVADLLVLAAALDVPPVVLVAPVGHVEQVEALPDDLRDPLEVAEWWSGTDQSSDSSWQVLSTQGLELGRTLRSWLARWRRDEAAAMEAPDDHARDLFFRNARADLRLARGARDAIVREGLVPPSLAPDDAAALLSAGGDD